MSGRFASLAAAASIAALIAGSTIVRAQNAPPPAYELVSRGNDGVELRFHNMPIRGVHADDAQNALAVDFQGQVDGGTFERLGADFPDWISLAYANYDTGVIRATRPVTFLTRAEADGFSLRIVPRAAGPAPAPGQVALRGQVDGPPPPMQPPYQPAPPQGSRFDAYGAMRNYDSLALALRRGDPMWSKAFERSSIESNSDVDFGTDYHAYHSGDRVISSQAHGRIILGSGLSLIGSVYDADTHADKVRIANGSFATNVNANKVGGAAGLALESGADTEISLEATQYNNVTGARLKAYSGDPDSWWIANITYHQALTDTPEELLNQGMKDEAVLGTAQHLDYGLWASLAGKVDNYGLHGNAHAVKTAGWDGNLHWGYDFGGWLTGLAYDGHGEYIWDHANYNGAAPTPYIPLSIRNTETHAVTASLSSLVWGDTLWFDLYGGYVKDRYASDGAVYGAGLRWQPAAGVDLALGARHSTVSFLQGEKGAETTAGITFTLGFNSIPLSGYF